ncbi:MAG: trypsin-like peptidase domain-containing protein [Lachnospiraceae bacterium]|nr:trypsin-like peptidase domain-containing protein [Lachnospiraceae bacterium]
MEPNNNNNENQQENSSTYSYSYVNPTPGQENPNETTGYQSGPEYQKQTEYRSEPENSGYYNQSNQGGYGQPYRTVEMPKKKRFQLKGFQKTMAKVVAIALVFGLVSSGVFVGVLKVSGIEVGDGSSVITYKSDKISSTAADLEGAKDVSDIVDAAMPSIVAITNTAESEVPSFFGSQTQQVESAGSGIIIGEDKTYIYVVTNNHVVEDSVALKVTFSDSESVDATIKGTNAGSDLAVVCVKKSDMKASTQKTIKVAVMGDSDSLKVGQSVIAIGNALGYGQTVTTGCVSAKDRSVTIDEMTSTLLQTDAAINPGNSGGALLNESGEVIGINSAKYSDTQVEGIGYAIPINDAQPIIEAIISRETVQEGEQGYLGVYGQDVTDDISSVYNMPKGVFVKQLVSSGAAQKAGIQAGDIIVGIDDYKITTMAELQSTLQYYKAGSTVTVKAKVKDGGEYVEKEFKVTLQKNTTQSSEQ